MSSKSKDFNRVLSKKDVLALAFGAMIGWGWIVLAGEWIKKAGSLGAAIAFILGGIMVLFVGLTYAELTSAMPECGGEHVFSHRALGENMSFICTWSIILGYISVVAFEAVALPTVVEYLFPNYVRGYMYTVMGYDVNFTWVLVGVVSSILITAINYIGVKPAAFLQGVLTFIVVAIGILFFLGSLVNGDPVNAKPLIVDGPKGILSVLIMTPFMFVGFDVIPQSAAEINLPFKKIGRILLMSVVMAIFWYVMIIYAVSLALNQTELNASTMVTADSMKAVYYNSTLAGKLMVIAGIGGILTSWNSFYVGGSRAIYAMADSKMLPKFLARVHPKYKTPTNAVLLVGMFSCIAPFFGRQMLSWLVNAGGITIVMAYLIVTISFLVLRYKEPNMKRPYKIKCGKLVGSIAVLLSLGMLTLYLPGAPAALNWPYEWGIIIGWSLMGAIFFAWAKLSYVANKEDEEKLLKVK
ncbi:APC family permease [Tepidibacter hydrothermalis]|uniref:APC family permease n=1 Tax=Tepidibacter hydrothermalis TaxID=3036126 RepID=A0ABY8EFS8_9FIRM|nr:APC family permease [Tepidibacter hydrothermalis]WFD11641.1 APC family permease [Tepidibacter hydrothermalis]